VAQSYDANGDPSTPLRAGMTERVVDGMPYAQGWDHENRLVWVSTGGVTTTFTYDANDALVKKEDPLVGTTYYVGPHYEVLVPAVILPPAPADLTACYESMGGPNVCNDLTWSGSSGATYNVYRSTTSPVPIDAGHLVTSGITETNYTDCGRYKHYYYAVTAVNENGESDPSNEAQASEPCGSAMALTLPVLKHYCHAG
jgi:YD repeat-containing protein